MKGAHQIEQVLSTGDPKEGRRERESTLFLHLGLLQGSGSAGLASRLRARAVRLEMDLKQDAGSQARGQEKSKAKQTNKPRQPREKCGRSTPNTSRTCWRQSSTRRQNVRGNETPRHEKYQGASPSFARLDLDCSGAHWTGGCAGPRNRDMRGGVRPQPRNMGLWRRSGRTARRPPKKHRTRRRSAGCAGRARLQQGQPCTYQRRVSRGAKRPQLQRQAEVHPLERRRGCGLTRLQGRKTSFDN